jgi:predicted nucleic acid-binding protein
LHGRAVAHLARVGSLRATVPAMLETFQVLRRGGVTLAQALGAFERAFILDQPELLFAIARALDTGLVKTAFDAFHLAEASRAGGALHTADRELLASAYPTVPF